MPLIKPNTKRNVIDGYPLLCKTKATFLTLVGLSKQLLEACNEREWLKLN